jgi:hypothetical protein
MRFSITPGSANSRASYDNLEGINFDGIIFSDCSDRFILRLDNIDEDIDEGELTVASFDNIARSGTQANY